MKKVEPMKHVWSIVCQNSITDQESNNLSLLSTLDSLSVNVPREIIDRVTREKSDGFLHPFKFEVITQVTRRNAEVATAVDYMIKIVTPEGKIAASIQQKIAIKEKLKNMRIRSIIPNLPLSVSGDYWIKVEIKEVADSKFIQVAELPIEITINPIDTSEKSV